MLQIDKFSREATVVSRLRKEFLEEYECTTELTRDEIELARAKAIQLLSPKLVRVAALVIGGMNQREAENEVGTRLPTKKKDHSTLEVYRRYIYLTEQSLAHDYIAKECYNRARWLEDQILILDKALGRAPIRVSTQEGLITVHKDNLQAANKAQETLGKAYGFFEHEKPEKPKEEAKIEVVENQQNNTINVTEININMDQAEATRLYRKALKDDRA